MMNGGSEGIIMENMEVARTTEAVTEKISPSASAFYSGKANFSELLVPFLRSDFENEAVWSDLSLLPRGGGGGVSGGDGSPVVFKVNKVLLGCASPLIRKVLGEVDVDCDAISLPDIDPDDLLNFLRRLYGFVDRDDDDEYVDNDFVPQSLVDVLQLKIGFSDQNTSEEDDDDEDDEEEDMEEEEEEEDDDEEEETSNFEVREEDDTQVQQFSHFLNEYCPSSSSSETNVLPPPAVSPLPPVPDLAPSNGDRLRCKYCSRTFRHLGPLKNHIKKNHPGKDDDDERLMSVLPNQQNYIQPPIKSEAEIASKKSEGGLSSRRSREKSTKCDVCDKVFSSVAGKKFHVKTVHEGVRRFLCKYCGKAFQQVGNMNAHVLAMHELKGLRPHECFICQKTFKLKQELDKHIALVHERNKVHVCELCGKDFVCKSSMKLHVRRVHYGQKEFLCEHCPKRFFSNSRLQEHMNIHTGIKPYKCPICFMSFSGDRVRRHIADVHERKRPFVCHICSKSYARSDALNNHLKTHSMTMTASTAVTTTTTTTTTAPAIPVPIQQSVVVADLIAGQSLAVVPESQ